MKVDSRIVVALDFASVPDALAFADTVNPSLCKLKVGKELFTASGPTLVEQLVKRDFDVFLDLKFHDIPNTVAQACKVAANLGVWMVNVHASGGRKMLETTREALEGMSHRPLLIAVTVLTSMGNDELLELGLPTAAQQVERLAKLTQSCGLDGVVCSAQEAAHLKQVCGSEFKLVTPGIRPAGAAVNDQTRIMTPKAALLAGSDYLVIGRPITQSDNPVLTLQQINAELAA
ncbi:MULTISPECIES: orotidine-5'-phosphate decarboxylase [Deefgea]|uniref:Orotidine 5'-phosphate decarboxylase n=1 Tax=Deefgea chitinilytica TaxID=570276 RepID=A0ABS2CBF0_9NEIS|nr:MULTISPECIES: orotidine-5'-phosphate decarboxylase [Deefgea]MBM5570696.1 orotidine-5'-phosphate decarboxylase [Deefgea chitinilytica]MBM9887925.1 orotidine-5'-phosphate decarboxylase [Deefgea sp. CFH1-16]